jgi:predicted LPLAT superfamily acyltransferase
VKSLEKMKNDGLIDDRLYEWADTLRLAGNEAAHDVNVTVSRDDARDMLEFTNAILDYLFSFCDKFERFKLRRKRST